MWRFYSYEGQLSNENMTLEPVVTTPTHIMSIIDLCYTNMKDLLTITP